MYKSIRLENLEKNKTIKIQIELEDKADKKEKAKLVHKPKYVLSIRGYVYDKKGECICGGQCMEEIDEVINHPKSDVSEEDMYKRQEIKRIWEVHHLNDMHAGTPKQEGWLLRNGIHNWANDYSNTCNELEKVGLLVDRGYKFGSGWLYQPIPDDVINYIEKL